jgi:hypothetical protein
MRIFLQNYETGKFFKSVGNWTDFLADAHEFPDAEGAVKVAQELRLQKVQMVVMTDDGKPLMGTHLDIDH